MSREVWSKVSNPAARDWRGRNRKKAAKILKNNGEGTNFAKRIATTRQLRNAYEIYLRMSHYRMARPCFNRQEHSSKPVNSGL